MVISLLVRQSLTEDAAHVFLQEKLDKDSSGPLTLRTPDAPSHACFSGTQEREKLEDRQSPDSLTLSLFPRESN